MRIHHQQAIWLTLALAGFATAVPAALAAGPTDQQLRFFEEQVRPVLAEHCFKCHGDQAQRGELRVDSLSSLLSGGESGPAIEPGKPDESLLVEAIRYDSLEMPPDSQLDPAQIAAITKWIEIGSPWPGHDDSVRKPAAVKPKISDEDRAYWAFQPLRDPPPPLDSDSRPRNDLDRFVLARLDAEGLTPAPEADRRTLARRLYFDLTGLPPSPEEVEAFVTDSAPKAYERLADRLLDSPRYGERWARHWLDLVRYAESDGFRQDAFRPHAWRYRDYVIGAFNDDKPYDRFILEQLAGDEIAPHDPQTLAATSYLRHGIYEYNQRDARTQWDNILIDITNVTGEVFLGLGMGCARCHDHKFDPILKEDYFRLKAFFTPLLPRDDLPYATGEAWQQHQTQLAAWHDKTAAIRAAIDELERPLVEAARRRAADKFPPDVRDMLLKEVSQRAPLEHQLAELANRQAGAEVANIKFGSQLKGEQKAKWDQLQGELKQFDDLRPKDLPPAFTVTDVGAVAPPTPMAAGREQRDVEPGLLTVLGPPPLTIVPPPSGNSTGRRTALARWLAGPDNPLTARVIVNRVWQQHFGVGLVATPSDFGRLGEPPSHPELLDWLACRFIADGWRFKPLHRLIVTSATYRQSSRHPDLERARRQDPDNRWLWHTPVRRLDSEQIRDAMLAVSGELDLTAGGPSVSASQPRRSIFTKAIRNTRDPMLDVFDMADPFISTDRRNVTTTPTQSLLMINGAWPLQRAEALARRLRKLGASDERVLVEQAYRLVYGRAAEPAEVEAMLHWLRDRTDGLTDLCHVLLNSNEFLYLD
jgi:mono/diheme cytochrome c family protein